MSHHNGKFFISNSNFKNEKSKQINVKYQSYLIYIQVENFGVYFCARLGKKKIMVIVLTSITDFLFLILCKNKLKSQI